MTYISNVVFQMITESFELTREVFLSLGAPGLFAVDIDSEDASEEVLVNILPVAAGHMAQHITGIAAEATIASRNT